jgi:hypothetical protein
MLNNIPTISISTGVTVGGGKNNNDKKKTANLSGYSGTIVAFGIMSLIYTIWYIVHIIRAGKASEWQFYIPGLMLGVGLQVVVIIVFVLSALQFFWQSRRQSCFCCNFDWLYFAMVTLGFAAMVMYMLCCIPLDANSSVWKWLGLWVPWGIISLVACCLPFCCARPSSQQLAAEDKGNNRDAALEAVIS